MKILTLAGTRPELIRLSVIIKKLDKIVYHVFVYSNQNFDYNLSGIFFDELGIRKPDYYFENKGYSIGQFLSNAFLEFEKVLIKEKPDKILILGDTNTGLLSLVANKFGIPIYHMEAGNRCFSKDTPEEINRSLIDHTSTYNLPYTESSKQNLLMEGFHRNFVFKTGNPICEIILANESKILDSKILSKYKLWSRQYVLFSIHRKENVDGFDTLKGIVSAVNKISSDKVVFFPVHPRTLEKINSFNLSFNKNVIISKPIGFFDFVSLEKNACLGVIDSGTALEELCILKTPSICVRNSTERPEVFECGASVLTGTNYDSIMSAFSIMLNRDNKWTVPQDYLVENVSDVVINFLIGKD